MALTQQLSLSSCPSEAIREPPKSLFCLSTKNKQLHRLKGHKLCFDSLTNQ